MPIRKYGSGEIIETRQEPEEDERDEREEPALAQEPDEEPDSD
jgi:hypothetical protein